MLMVAGKHGWSRVPQFQLQRQRVGYSCSFLRIYYSKNCCRYPIVSMKNIRSSINWSVGPNWCVAELPWMCVIVNMLCAVRWPAVTNMELMLWTQIVVYFDNTFTFTRLRVCLTRMPPRHRPQLRHGSRRHRHRPRLRPRLRRCLFHNIPCHKNCRICCLAEMWLYKLRMVAGLCWCSAVQGKLPFCDCKYVVCSAVIGSHQDKAHAAEHKLYFYNKYRVSHNTGLIFFLFFLSVYIHPKCKSWGSF